MIWKLAIRNVAGQPRRTFFMGMALAFCSLCMVVGGSVVDSLGSGTERTLRAGLLGDLEVVDEAASASDFTEEAPSDPVLVRGWRDVRARLLGHASVRAVSPRLSATGLLSAGDVTAPVNVIGIDPALETGVCPELGRIGGGLLPSGGIVLGAGLAERLRRGPGGKVTLLLPTPDGLFEGDTFEVAEVRSPAGFALLGELFAFVPLGDLQRLTDSEDGVGALAVALRPGVDPAEAKARLAAGGVLAGAGVRIRTWDELAGPFLAVGRIGGIGLAIGNTLLTLIILLSLADTILVIVLERGRDIGTMLALGTSRARVLGSLLAEIAIVSGVAAAVGTLIGGALCLWLGRSGVPFPTRAQALAYGGERFFVVLSMPRVGAAFAAVAVLGPLAALFPAIKASRVDPVRALRSA